MALCAAAQEGWLPGVRRLMTDPPPGLEGGRQKKDVALLLACHHGHLSVVQWFLTPPDEGNGGGGGGGGMTVAHDNWHALRTAAAANQGEVVAYLVQCQLSAPQHNTVAAETADAWRRALDDAVRLAVKEDAVDAVEVLVPTHLPLSLELLCNAVADDAHRVLVWMFEEEARKRGVHQLLELERGVAGRLSLPFTIALMNAGVATSPAPAGIRAIDLLWAQCVLPFDVADVAVEPGNQPSTHDTPSGATFRTIPLYAGIFNGFLPLVQWACETAGADPCDDNGNLFASARRYSPEPIVWYLWDRLLHPGSTQGEPLPSRLTADRAQDGVDGKVSYERFVAWASHHGRHDAALYLLAHPPTP